MNIKSCIFSFVLLTTIQYPAFCSLLINVPGNYKIQDDIVYTPTGPNDTIFLITSNDVLLDLNHKTISQSNTTTGLNGITISPDVSNVQILNGTISVITGTGIVVNEGCQQIRLDNMTLRSCAGRGIAFTGTNTNRILDSEIINCDIIKCGKGESGDVALFLQWLTILTIANCRISNTGGSTNDTSAVRISNAFGINCDNALINATTGGVNVSGFDLTNITDSIFSKCIVRRNTTAASNGVNIGYRLQTACLNNTFQNCSALVSTATTSSSTFDGFRINTGNDNNLFIQCNATQNDADGNCVGFNSLSNNRNNFNDCIAQQNNSSAGPAGGFNFDTCTNNVCLRCIADGNTSAASASIGINVDTCTECFFQENRVNYNVGTPNSFGMRLVGGVRNIFTKNIAAHNGTTVNNQLNGFAANQKTDITPDIISTVSGAWTNLGITA